MLIICNGNEDALFMECNKLSQNVTNKMPYSRNVMGYRSRNNGMLRNDLQTDLVTFIS